MILVFINNKLNTIDTILPILLEMKEKHDKKSYVILNEELAYNGIKDNVVINDIVNKVGTIIYLGKGINNKILRRFFTLIQIQRLIIYSLMGAKIIHFGRLDDGFLHSIFNVFRKNILFSQALAFKYVGHKYRRDFIEEKSTKFTGQSLIATDGLMPELESINTINKKIYIFGPTRMRKTWLEHSYYLAEDYLKKCHPNIRYRDGYIVIVLYHFGAVDLLDGIETSKILLKDTLDIINELYPNKNILIKPHVVTELDILNKIIDESGNQNINITYLHPCVLSRFADMFICNCYSNTLADASSLGVTTIEYTKYKKYILERTQGRSIGHHYVDYFIDYDKILLKKILKNIKIKKVVTGTPLLKNVLIDDPAGLLDDLAN
jgi:hypothetical protein